MVNVRALVLDLLQELESHIGARKGSAGRSQFADLLSPLVRDKLRLLLQYSRKLAVFQKRATLVQECLEEVLENGAFDSEPVVSELDPHSFLE